MVRPQRHYRVWPEAWRHWEKLDEVPFLLTDVVDAMEALPESDLSVVRTIRPPAVFHKVRGTVFGMRFEILGVRTADGQWVEVMTVKPAGRGGRMRSGHWPRLGAREDRMKQVFLKEPKVEVFKGRKGRFEGVHVSLQRKGRKARRGLTPNPDVMLDFLVDAEGRPVAMGMSEPLDAPTIVRSICMFLDGYEEPWEGGPAVRMRPAITDPVVVSLLLRAVEKLAPRLAPWPVHPATQKWSLSA